MHLPADFFLALRYLRPKRTFVSIITLLSILGPVLGVAILLIVSAVMAGFDRDIKAGIMNLQAHVQVYPAWERAFSSPTPVITKMTAAGVDAAPLFEGSALLQIRDSILPKIVRGIDPEQERKVTGLADAMVRGRYELRDGEALIGDRLAFSLRLSIGDAMLIHSPARLTSNVKWHDDGKVDVTTPDEVYLPEEVKIAGIFSMGMADFDDNIIFLTLDQAAELFGHDWGAASCVQGKVADPLNMDEITRKLKKALPGATVVTWQERNQLLFGTLRVEKNLMTFLMAFIVLVASFSIAATLITVVVQKTREIGVMKAVGMSRFLIARIFLLQGGIIGVIGTVAGTLLGLLVIALRNQIAGLLSLAMGHDVFPAELYHLTKIPALLTADDLIRTVVLAIVICVLAALVPALYASALAPARALQEEN
ncbi:MAG TPA: ABC transporter permease [Lentisphaeria bacterium]|nr:ABC transporter permease [Lentisphaeria bacterium]